jgi:hypothetical protein
MIRTLTKSIWRFRVPIGLVLLAMAAGWGARSIVPLSLNPTGAQSFFIEVDLDPNELGQQAQPKLLSFDLKVYPDQASHWTQGQEPTSWTPDQLQLFHLAVDIVVTETPVQYVQLTLAAPGKLTGCPGYSCKAPARTAFGGTPLVTLLPLRPSSGGYTAEGSLTFTILAKALGYSSTGYDSVAQLPTIDYIIDTDQTTYFRVEYMLPYAYEYEWATGPQPTFFTPWIYWDLAPRSTAYGPIGNVYASGFNRAAQSQRDFALFIAGALVGVAGGAVVGALQELLRGQ